MAACMFSSLCPPFTCSRVLLLTRSPIRDWSMSKLVKETTQKHLLYIFYQGMWIISLFIVIHAKERKKVLTDLRFPYFSIFKGKTQKRGLQVEGTRVPGWEASWKNQRLKQDQCSLRERAGREGWYEMQGERCTDPSCWPGLSWRQEALLDLEMGVIH